MRRVTETWWVLAGLVAGAAAGILLLALSVGSGYMAAMGAVLLVLATFLAMVAVGLLGLACRSLRGWLRASPVRPARGERLLHSRRYMPGYGALAIVPLAALVVVSILAALSGWLSVPVASLLAIAGLFYAVLTLAVVSHGGALGVPAGTAASRRLLELVSSAPPGRPLSITAVGAEAACPYGFITGNRWTVDAEGHLRPGLCRSAVESLEAAFHRREVASGREVMVACRCPLGGRRLTFAVHAESPEEVGAGGEEAQGLTPGSREGAGTFRAAA
jgi:hypothetical protein